MIFGSFKLFFQFKNGFLAIFEMAKNGFWSKKFIKLIYLISRGFLAWPTVQYLFTLIESFVYYSTGLDDGDTATVTSTAATFLYMFFAIATFVIIYIFKFYVIKEFRNARIQDQLVHVLANTLVVIPFMSWDQKKPDTDEFVDADDILDVTTEKMLSEAAKVQEKKSAIEAAAKLKKQKSEEDLHKKVHKKVENRVSPTPL